MHFPRAVAAILDHEGGFTKNPNDPGNWTGGKVGVGELKGTNMGISAYAYPEEDIENLTPDRARFLYRRDYWLPSRYHEIVHEGVAVQVFKLAVNTQPRGLNRGAANQCLQRACNRTLSVSGPATLLKVDGIVGPATLKAVNGHPCPAHLEDNFRLRAIEYYLAIRRSRNWTVERHNLFFPGWVRRVLD